jgi:hypothetical protein
MKIYFNTVVARESLTQFRSCVARNNRKLVFESSQLLSDWVDGKIVLDDSPLGFYPSKNPFLRHNFVIEPELKEKVSEKAESCGLPLYVIMGKLIELYLSERCMEIYQI